MNPFSLLPLSLASFLFTSLSHAAEPPPAVAALKATGANVTAIREGGWAVDVRDAKILTDEVWKTIEALPEVKKFSSGGDAFDDAALARLSKVSSIETLFFNGPAITDEGLTALTRFSNLQRFGVDHSTKITGSGLAALSGSPKLAALHFGGCIIGDTGVAVLVQLPQLRDVALGHTRITRASFPLLAKLPNLERLEITPNWDPRPYTAADFAAFAPMQNLRELEIHDMPLPWENGLVNLAPLHNLKALKLYWCYITEADLGKIKAGLPNVKLDVQNPAGDDRLKQYNEKLDKLRAEK